NARGFVLIFGFVASDRGIGMKPKLNLSLLLLLASAALSQGARASTLRVPADYSRIQAAIDAAANGDTELVSPVTYTETLIVAGKGINLKSEQGPQVTILDGNHLAPVVIFKTASAVSSSIQGFTIQNGTTEYQSFSGAGVSIEFVAAAVIGNIIK